MVLTLIEPGSNRLYWFTTRIQRYLTENATSTISQTNLELILNKETPEDI